MAQNKRRYGIRPAGIEEDPVSQFDTLDEAIAAGERSGWPAYDVMYLKMPGDAVESEFLTLILDSIQASIDYVNVSVENEDEDAFVDGLKQLLDDTVTLGEPRWALDPANARRKPQA